MKKIVTFLMVAAMLFVLCACNNTQTEVLEPTESTTTTPTETTSNTDNNQKPSDEIDKVPLFNDPNFEDIVIGDTDTVTVTITGLHLNDERGCVVDIIVKNKWGKAVKLFVPKISINGVLLASSLYNGSSEDTVSDGKLEAFKTACYEIIINKDVLEKYNITKFTDIELTAQVSDYALLTSGYRYLLEPTVTHIYPYGEDNVEKFVYNAVDSDVVLLDNEFAKMIVTGINYDEEGNAFIDVFVFNKKDSEYTIATTDDIVNGCEMNTYFTETLPNNAFMLAQIEIKNTNLKKFDIEKITNIKMNMYGGYGHAFEAVTHFREPVELNFD